MTELSLGIAFGVALLISAASAFMLRRLKLTRDSESLARLAVAAGSGLGLALLQVSSVADLSRAFAPRVAVDCVPAIVLLAACATLANGKYRIAAAIVLGIASPMWLLWGSVYADTDQWTVFGLGIVTMWVSAMALVIAVDQNSESDDSSNALFQGKHVALTLVFAGIAVLLGSTGSLLYAAASGIAGAAVLGTLLATGRFTNLAMLPQVVLLGLAAAFSDLAVATAFVAMIALVVAAVAKRMAPKLPATLGPAFAAICMSVVAVPAAVKFASELQGDAYAPGYSTDGDIAVQESDMQTITENGNASQVLQPTTSGEVDPFGGMGLVPGP